MITRLQLERWQVAVYVVAIAAGCALGLTAPTIAPMMERALWYVLAALLYVTFAQVPLDHLAEAALGFWAIFTDYSMALVLSANSWAK